MQIPKKQKQKSDFCAIQNLMEPYICYLALFNCKWLSDFSLDDIASRLSRCYLYLNSGTATNHSSNDGELKGALVTTFRSLTVRGAYLAQDRYDLQHATKELATEI